MQTFNEVLYQKRIEKNLTIKEASKKIGVFSRTLKNAELGYYPLPKKALKKAGALYETDLEELYNNTFAYTKQVAVKNKSGKFQTKAINILRHRITKIVLLVLLLASIVWFGFNVYFRAQAIYNPRSFAQPEYLVMYDNIINRGQEVEPNTFTYTKQFSEGLAVFTVKSEKNPFNYKIYGTLADNDMTFTLHYYSTFSAFDLFAMDFFYTSKTQNYKGSFERTGKTTFQAIKYYQLVGEDWQVVTEDNQAFKTIETIINVKMAECDNVLNKAVKSLAIDADIYDLISGAIDSQSQITAHTFLLGIYLSFSISFFLILLLLFAYFDKIKVHFINKMKKTIATQSKPTINVIEYHPLPKDIKIFPPFKEMWEQILGLVFLLVAGIGTIIGTCSILNVWGVPQSQSLEKIARILAVFMPISMILLLYNKLDMYSKKQDIAKTVVIFLLLGILFYLLEALSIFIITRIDSEPTEILNKIIALIIPGNFFFGMALYATMAMFLFTTPKWCNTKKRLKLWRLGAIIPLAYFAIGFLLNYTKEMFGFTLTPYLQCFFFSKNIIITLFAFGLLAIKFFMQKNVYKTYGEKNGQLYCTGNRYTLTFNLYVTILLSTLVVVCYILPDIITGNNESTLNYLLYFFVLVPCILLCAHRKQNRSTKGDAFYTAIYSLLICIPILICVGAVVEKMAQIIF